MSRSLFIVPLIHIVFAQEAVADSPCLVTAGARSFNLSELATPLLFTSQEAETLGWVYAFSACLETPTTHKISGCEQAPPSAVLQATGSACYSLGELSTRKVVATKHGLFISFGGGDRCGADGSPRTTEVTVECADLSPPRAVQWSHGATPCSYKALIRSRAACAVGCSPGNAAGAMCGEQSKRHASTTSLPEHTSPRASLDGAVSALVLLGGVFVFRCALCGAGPEKFLARWALALGASFAGGVVLGGTLAIQRNDTTASAFAQRLAVAPKRPAPADSAENGDWAWTAVYRGNATRLPHLEKQWTAQVGQDRSIVEIFNSKRGGFFLDLAAHDASFLSNTLMLEQAFGWRGICVEANPEYAKSFSGRSCRLAQAVVGPRDNELVNFVFDSWAGGIEGFDKPVSRGVPREDTGLRTVSVARILDDFGAPPVIDYLSLDIEGAEWWAFSTFPWHRYVFLTITVERPKTELREQLRDVCSRFGV